MRARRGGGIQRPATCTRGARRGNVGARCNGEGPGDRRPARAPVAAAGSSGRRPARAAPSTATAARRRQDRRLAHTRSDGGKTAASLPCSAFIYGKDSVLCSDRSHYRSDVCYLHGDVRTDPSTSSVLLYNAPRCRRRAAAAQGRHRRR
ncbi:hypothetical protein U9M48_042024 [Paspalum notatum var. saurae]|uniref:Uncharacterized protein n=1 Tax=Paspalum notatum var. saurae TaxID=547442 RepID=A0AAQ3XET8_PASNO